MSTTVYPQVYSEGVITPITYDSHDGITETSEINKMLNFTINTGNNIIIRKNNIVELYYRLDNVALFASGATPAQDAISGLWNTNEAIIGNIPEGFRPPSNSFNIYGQCVCLGTRYTTEVELPTSSQFLTPVLNYFSISSSGNIRVTLSGDRSSNNGIPATGIAVVIIHATYMV